MPGYRLVIVVPVGRETLPFIYVTGKENNDAGGLPCAVSDNWVSQPCSQTQ